MKIIQEKFWRLLDKVSYFANISYSKKYFAAEVVNYLSLYNVHRYKWYFVTKIVLTYCEKKMSYRDGEKLLKCEAVGREFVKFLRSLEQFIQAVQGQNNNW